MADGKPGRPGHPPEVRQRALTILAAPDGGLAAASLATGISKSTIRDWAKHEEIDVAAAQVAQREQTAAATAAQQAANQRRIQDAIENLIPKLATLAHLSLDAQLTALRTVKEAQGRLDGPPLTGEETQRLMRRMEVALGGVEIRDLVGVGTRAIGDLVRLRGGGDPDKPEGQQAGSAGSVNVYFITPPPTEKKHAIIDLPPVAPLGIGTSEEDD